MPMTHPICFRIQPAKILYGQNLLAQKGPFTLESFNVASFEVGTTAAYRLLLRCSELA